MEFLETSTRLSFESLQRCFEGSARQGVCVGALEERLGRAAEVCGYGTEDFPAFFTSEALWKSSVSGPEAQERTAHELPSGLSEPILSESLL